MLAWIALVGCSFPLPDCADGYARNAEEQCVKSMDTGSGEGLVLTGEYMGDIALAVAAEAGPLEIEDNCVGTVSFDRYDRVLDGTVECEFEGAVDGLVNSQQFSGTLDGVIEESGDIGGQIVLDLDIFGVLDEPWVGSATDEQIVGSVSGAMDFEVAGLVVPVDFAGQFEANR